MDQKQNRSLDQLKWKKIDPKNQESSSEFVEQILSKVKIDWMLQNTNISSLAHELWGQHLQLNLAKQNVKAQLVLTRYLDVLNKIQCIFRKIDRIDTMILGVTLKRFLKWQKDIDQIEEISNKAYKSQTLQRQKRLISQLKDIKKKLKEYNSARCTEAIYFLNNTNKLRSQSRKQQVLIFQNAIRDIQQRRVCCVRNTKIVEQIIEKMEHKIAEEQNKRTKNYVIEITEIQSSYDSDCD